MRHRSMGPVRLLSGKYPWYATNYCMVTPWFSSRTVIDMGGGNRTDIAAWMQFWFVLVERRNHG